MRQDINRNSKEFAIQLEKRTKDFAIKILKLCAKITNKPEAQVVKYQLSKSGTSIGANYREANRSRSKADFKNKIRICESESSESQYWLEIVYEMNFYSENNFDEIFNECTELLAIFTSIGKTLST